MPLVPLNSRWLRFLPSSIQSSSKWWSLSLLLLQIFFYIFSNHDQYYSTIIITHFHYTSAIIIFQCIVNRDELPNPYQKTFQNHHLTWTTRLCIMNYTVIYHDRLHDHLLGLFKIIVYMNYLIVYYKLHTIVYHHLHDCLLGIFQNNNLSLTNNRVSLTTWSCIISYTIMTIRYHDRLGKKIICVHVAGIDTTYTITYHDRLEEELYARMWLINHVLTESFFVFSLWACRLFLFLKLFDTM